MTSTRFTSRFFVPVLIAFLGCSLTDAQSLKLGLKGGVLYLVSTESSDSREDIYTKQEGGFGFGPWAPWVGVEVRYSPPRGRVVLIADASYSWLNGDGTIQWVESSGSDYTGQDFQGNLYIVSGGAQWDFLTGPVQPYLGFRLLWTHLKDVSNNAPIAPVGGFDRFGLGLLGGTTIDLSSPLALDICVRYNFTNISSPGGYNPYFNSLYIGTGLLFEVL